MLCTNYFEQVRKRADRIIILDEWIQMTVQNPTHRTIQADGRLRFWKQIHAAQDRWLRVIVLEDGLTVHNAFFDRRFKGE